MNVEYAFLYTERETAARNIQSTNASQLATNNRIVIKYGLRDYVPVKDTFTFPAMKKET